MHWMLNKMNVKYSLLDCASHARKGSKMQNQGLFLSWHHL